MVLDCSCGEVIEIGPVLSVLNDFPFRQVFQQPEIHQPDG